MDSDEDDSYILRAERDAKQNYLREEIIENNYDGELFMWYISSIREANIDDWDFEDLQQAVRDFKMKYRRGQTLDEVNPKVNNKPLEVEESEEKLNLIQSEVVDKGYNPELFKVFLDQTFSHSNIESLTLEELEKLIEQFQQSLANEFKEVSLKTEEVNNQTNEEVNEFCVQPLTTIHNEDQVDTGSNRVDTQLDTENTEIIPCGTMNETELTFLTELDSSCTSASIKDPGFFSKKFIEYDLITPSLGWSVKRRYSDFLWLRNILTITNPGSFIPPIPTKKVKGNFCEKYINKRKLLLNNFLKSVLHDPVLRSSPDTLEFLRETSSSTLLKYQNSRNKTQKPGNFNEILTLNGDTLCDFNENQDLFQTLNDYLEVSLALETQFKTKIKDMIESTQHLSKTINEFSEILQELQETDERTTENSKILFESAINSIFKWSAHEEINANNLKSDLKLHFAIKTREKPIMQDLLNQRQYYFSAFQKAHKHKKANSDLMTNTKNLFGHFNYKIKSELERTITDQILFDTEHLRSICQHEINKSESLEALWDSASEDFHLSPSFL